MTGNVRVDASTRSACCIAASIWLSCVAAIGCSSNENHSHDTAASTQAGAAGSNGASGHAADSGMRSENPKDAGAKSEDAGAGDPGDKPDMSSKPSTQPTKPKPDAGSDKSPDKSTMGSDEDAGMHAVDLAA